MCGSCYRHSKEQHKNHRNSLLPEHCHHSVCLHYIKWTSCCPSAADFHYVSTRDTAWLKLPLCQEELTLLVSSQLCSCSSIPNLMMDINGFSVVNKSVFLNETLKWMKHSHWLIIQRLAWIKSQLWREQFIGWSYWTNISLRLKFCLWMNWHRQTETCWSPMTE